MLKRSDKKALVGMEVGGGTGRESHMRESHGDSQLLSGSRKLGRGLPASRVRS